MKISLLLSLILILHCSYGQTTSNVEKARNPIRHCVTALNIEKARNAYKQSDYKIAVSFYNKALNSEVTEEKYILY